MKYQTNSDIETVKLGERLGSYLSAGDLIALTGDIGSGKTWFTKGIAGGLEVEPGTIITSPSFSLVNEYRCREHFFYHIDLYRLDNLSDLLYTGLEEYLHMGGVIVMEWADRWPEILPEHRMDININILGDHTREITLRGSHPRPREIIKEIANDFRGQ